MVTPLKTIPKPQESQNTEITFTPGSGPSSELQLEGWEVNQFESDRFGISMDPCEAAFVLRKSMNMLIYVRIC